MLQCISYGALLFMEVRDRQHLTCYSPQIIECLQFENPYYRSTPKGFLVLSQTHGILHYSYFIATYQTL